MLDNLEIISCNSNQDRRYRKQQFSYLFVLDFEATCWNTTEKNYKSEIIEFPVVLYDVKCDKIVKEFQQYVKPTEHPKLSDFCTELTGIQQYEVDRGITLSVCLDKFMQWLDEVKKTYNIEFPGENGRGKKKCCFVTWSDWDLATCLKNECKRKHLEVNPIFRKWIDLRALYKSNYRRPLTGLSGALLEVGLEFEGRQHCGLDDARNTARLASKMISDGIVFQLTKDS